MLNPDSNTELSTIKLLTPRQQQVLQESEVLYEWELFEKNGDALLVIGERHPTSDLGEQLAENISLEFMHIAFEGVDLNKYYFPALGRAFLDAGRKALIQADPINNSKRALMNRCAIDEQKISAVRDDLAAKLNKEFANGSKQIVLEIDNAKFNLNKTEEKYLVLLITESFRTNNTESVESETEIEASKSIKRIWAEKEHNPDLLEKLTTFNLEFSHLSRTIMASDTSLKFILADLAATVSLSTINYFINSEALAATNFYLGLPLLAWGSLTLAKVIQNKVKPVEQLFIKINLFLIDYGIKQRNKTMIAACIDYLAKNKLVEPLVLATGKEHLPDIKNRLIEIGWKLIGESRKQS